MGPSGTVSNFPITKGSMSIAERGRTASDGFETG